MGSGQRDCHGDGRGRPNVSVIVPHYQDLRNLDLCLDALQRQTFPADDFEIIVADNNSPEGEAAVSRIVNGRAHLMVVRDKGAASARNGGVRHASGEILAFTDSDCRPDPHWLTEGITALATFDFLGGCMRVVADDPTRMSAEEAFEAVFAFDNQAYVTGKGFTVSANLFCSRAVFDSVGGFRKGVSEDVDWCHRALQAGYRIGYASDAVVAHPARRDWPELTAKWKRVDAETYGLYEGRRGARLIWLARCVALPLSAVAHTPRVLASRALPGLDRKLAALGVLYKLRFWRCWDSLRLLFGRRGLRL